MHVSAHETWPHAPLLPTWPAINQVIYVVVDNLIYPSRAKLLLRRELVDGVKAMIKLSEDGLSVFLGKVREVISVTY